MLETLPPSMPPCAGTGGARRRRAGLDMQLQTLESFGQTVTDEQYRQMERMAPYAGYFTAASQIVAFPLVTLAIGLGVLYKRRTAPIATTMFVVYGAIALTIAAVRSVLAGE